MQKAFILAACVAQASAFVAPEHADIAVDNTRTVTYAQEQNGFLRSARRATMDPVAIAREVVQEKLGKVEMTLKDNYVSKNSGTRHLVFTQTLNGIEIANADVSVNINKHGQVINMVSSGASYESLARQDSRLARARVTTQPLDAVKSFLKHAKLHNGEVTPSATAASIKGDFHSFTFTAENPLSRALKVEEQTVEARLVYTMDSEGELQLTWAVNVESEAPHYAMYVANMPAEYDSEVPVLVYDLVKWVDATGLYNVYAAPAIDPLLGDRVIENELQNDISPSGWHNNEAPEGDRDTTWGNNVRAQENRDGSSAYINNYRPVKTDRNFDSRIDFTQNPDVGDNQDASITNLFYWNNHFHDVMYTYGWDEVAGNMQDDNFGRGGLGNDGLQANAMDGAGFNNANQATPADGGRGRQRMYLWNRVTPNIDGDYDSGIIIHEYAHSLSNRLTGGPSQAGCLPSGQSGGMGEGWGDALATLFMARPEHDRSFEILMGEYAAGRGIRQFPYSTSMTNNPDTYRTVGRTYNAVHAVGAVWCNMLYNVYWGMRDRFGLELDYLKDPFVPEPAGNQALMANMVEGMKLQGCRPDFISARNGIMQSDADNYNCRHVCTMWSGFASRGLGWSATSTGTGYGTTTEAFDLPEYCSSELTECPATLYPARF